MTPYLIFSWEHNAFWRPLECGYTRFIERAGRYTKERAEEICKNANYGVGRRHGSEDGLTDAEPNEICFPAPEALERLAKASGDAAKRLSGCDDAWRFDETIRLLEEAAANG